MATISAVSPVQMQQQAPINAKDADGDTDGSKAPAATPAAPPVISKPTATLGNHVNTHA